MANLPNKKEVLLVKPFTIQIFGLNLRPLTESYNVNHFSYHDATLLQSKVMSTRYLLFSRTSITTGLSAFIGAVQFSSVTHAEAPAADNFDLLVVGAGSGGIACGEMTRCTYRLLAFKYVHTT